MEAVKVISSLVHVPCAAVDMDRLRSDLWVRNLATERNSVFGQKGGKPGIRLYQEQGDSVAVPRAYAIPWKSGVNVLVRDERPLWESNPWEPVRKPLAHQEDALRAMRATAGDKTLVLACGLGKTTVSLQYAASLGHETLVIVDRDFLIDQWTTETCANYGCSPEEVGRIQANVFRIGKRVTIAMVHTLAKRLETGELDEAFFRRFGLVIADEAHVMSAPTFGKVMPMFPGERLALSATPKRADGMEAVFLMHAGGMEPCHVNIARAKSSSWFFVGLKNLAPPNVVAKMYRRVPGISRPVLNRPLFDSLLGKSEVFEDALIHNVKKAVQAGRNIIVLGNRTEQLERAAERAKREGLDAAAVTGGVKSQERLEAFQHQLLFVTDKIGSKALDIKRLDTLFLLYPTDDEAFIRQAVGRIEREMPGKKSPTVVVFYAADVPSLSKKARKMHEAILRVDAKAVIRHT